MDHPKEPKGPKKTSNSTKPAKPQSHILFSLCLFMVTVCAVVVRVWAINHPGEVVFDEVHFGKFASFYLVHKLI